MEQMTYELVSLEPITIAGISLRTNNSGAGMEKIQQHWGNFFQQDVLGKIDGKQESAICEAYFDYESDANGAYTLMLGSRIEPSAKPVAGLQTCTLPAANYAKFHINNPQAIRSAWQHIWSRDDLVRSYSGDFEVIGEDGADIYVAVRQ
ncbi:MULTISPECIES: GyrI-like domain-containing protein [unclassified Undibacterium]|uniref:GyrI-like domain-containing protein n=1 Tax=unclassified Undibacterium TaxID=2630295 RepID=UPI002AC93499|nr:MULTISPECIES: GyrI-like domain-containing protein [unclassified Undibacterium]MEB0138383.1 GyrI-like domain-containing protein [Undibacterium sp. CCC2.1]MEB0171258.1 GyrI-like domain-containing protein [Undibacterium sp. CCC1.1]MEB0176620.1 GyrI-like domain-containing protein [Undibacterium sp. CCC3.4]MEB0214011.1 GyrI-like domain-containing protein [Undibacterium sp. 5I2]WPX43627.1 GyrI-like domain-containing protein [Undibacterium sp. CCC3.4]